jgi:hypothetical protein
MADRIEITMKDGTKHTFNHEGRPGGSYTKAVKYEGAFVIVVDEWGSQTAFPAADVASVHVAEARWW